MLGYPYRPWGIFGMWQWIRASDMARSIAKSMIDRPQAWTYDDSRFILSNETIGLHLWVSGATGKWAFMAWTGLAQDCLGEVVDNLVIKPDRRLLFHKPDTNLVWWAYTHWQVKRYSEL